VNPAVSPENTVSDQDEKLSKNKKALSEYAFIPTILSFKSLGSVCFAEIF